MDEAATVEQRLAAVEAQVLQLRDAVRAHLIKCPGHPAGAPLP